MDELDYENPWTYNGSRFDSSLTDGLTGFVYVITNLTNDRKYVGQKKFWAPKTSFKKNPKTGVRKKVKTQVESGWRLYYGSNLELQADVVELGTTNFKREILELCKTKGWMNYLEMKEQIIRNVLLDDNYYNAFIGGKIHRSHVK